MFTVAQTVAEENLRVSFSFFPLCLPVIGPLASTGRCHDKKTLDVDEVMVKNPYGGEDGAEIKCGIV